jgi:hypothetical protein
VRLRRPSSALLGLLLVTGILSACSLPGGSRARCVDYISFATPADRYRAAELVVEARLTKTGGTVADFSIYPEYRADVLKVLKGDPPRGVLHVISTSDQCETQGQPARYVDRDPLASAGTRILYLAHSSAEGVWRLVVPGAADPISVAGQLP